jgi:hypothetical protein
MKWATLSKPKKEGTASGNRDREERKKIRPA